MSNTFKALSLKERRDWNTSIYCFNRANRLKMIWEKDASAKTILKNYFQAHLTAAPQFKHTPSKVVIQMFYYTDPNYAGLDKFEIEPLERLLSRIYGSEKFIELRFVRLTRPYLNAEILAKFLARNAETRSWGIVARQLFRTVPIVKPLAVPILPPPIVDWTNLIPHSSNPKIVSAIQGVKFQVTGRLGRRKGASRTGVLRKSVGTFRFKTTKSMIDMGRYNFSNRNGSITVKVWVSTALFGVGMVAAKAATALGKS